MSKIFSLIYFFMHKCTEEMVLYLVNDVTRAGRSYKLIEPHGRIFITVLLLMKFDLFFYFSLCMTLWKKLVRIKRMVILGEMFLCFP